MSWFYAAETDYQKVAAALHRSADRGETAGLDSEFYGLDVRKQSCAGGRSRVHMWSVAIPRHPYSWTPRGYRRSDAVVLLAAAFDHPGIRSWLESAAPKAVHNLPVDAHSFANHGVAVGGTINTLARARWCWPDRARGAGYSLDALGTDILGIGKTESFADVFSHEVDEVVRMKRKRLTSCSCGVEGCRKRKGHIKTETIVEEPVIKRVVKSTPLESVLPGHPRWERAVAYSARDAVLALALNDVMDRMMERTVPFPW